MHVPSEKRISPFRNNLRKNINYLISKVTFKDFFIINLSLAFLLKIVLPKSCLMFGKVEEKKTGLASLPGGGGVSFPGGIQEAPGSGSG